MKHLTLFGRLLCGACLLAAFTIAGCSGSNNSVSDSNSAGADQDVRYSNGTVTEDGYLTADDGTRLRYHMERAEDAPPGPVVMQYDGYDAGTGSYFSDIPAVKARLMELGYTILGISVRGTGCSTGAFDLFDPQRAIDGAEAVEWAAEQPWSNGKIGMIGYSYPGIMQLLVAGQRPPHLLAIAPANVVFDLYRDVGSPGGIPNAAFTTLFTAQQEAPGAGGITDALAQSDPECATNHLANRLAYQSFVVEGLQSPHIDGPFDWSGRSAATTASQIDVPVLHINYWQDEQTGSRLGGLLEPGGLLNVLGLEKAWTLMSNGNHDVTWGHPLYAEMLVEFYEHYLRGVDNGWENTPRIQIMHELGTTDSEPSWITAHNQLPKPEAATLYLREAGTLATAPPTTPEASESYIYPLLSSSTNPLPDSTDALNQLWQLPAPDAGRLVWTTPALEQDVQLLGSASLDLWMSSTADDTDVQATITEVRADGQEVYVARGWLRASKRALDDGRSTATRPFHDFTAGTADNLQPNEATFMRIEVFPFAHRFRVGSALRLIVDAPISLTGDWGPFFTPIPAVNTVLHDSEHASKLVISVLEDTQQRPVALPCGELANQPCRDSIAPMPAGALRVSP